MGYVYVAESGDGFCKIGKSNNPEARMSTIECSTGLKITRWAAFECVSDAVKTERFVHRKFPSNSVFGEWFEVCFDDAVSVCYEASKDESIGFFEVKNKPIPVIQVTENQRKWIDSEIKRTGNSESSIIRSLIQEKVEKKN